MNESIEETLTRGYRGWRSNLVLGVPFLADMLITLLVLVLLSLLIILSFFLANGTTSMDSWKPGMLYNEAWVIAFFVLCLLAFFAIVYIKSFFFSASMGMAKKVVLYGKTGSGDILPSGKSKASSVFISWIFLLFLLVLPAAALAFIILALYQIHEARALLFILFAGSGLYVSYAVVLMFLYTAVPASIVLKEKGFLEGVREGIDFGKKNRMRILLFYAMVFNLIWAVNLVFGLVTGPFYLLGMVLPLINLLFFAVFSVLMLFVYSFVVSPLYVLWLTRIYLD